MLAVMDKIDTETSEGLRDGSNDIPRNRRTNPSDRYLQGHGQASIYRNGQHAEDTKALRGYNRK